MELAPSSAHAPADHAVQARAGEQRTHYRHVAAIVAIEGRVVESHDM